MLKKLLSSLYILVIVAMAAATFIEKWRGTDFAHAAVYSAWWFVALWALLAAAAVAYIVRRRVRRPSVLALHLALLLILAGALATHVSGERGMVHLRCGVAVDAYSVIGRDGGVEERKLPFTMRLDTFDIRYHDGTEAEADYVSKFTVTDGGVATEAEVSMNNIYTHRSMRFYQADYDRDRLGSTLAVNYDPWGIPLTYAGYGLLFLSLLWTLVDPRGAYRRLLRSPLLRRGVLQVLTGFIFYGDEWGAEPVVRVKSGALKDALQLPRYCSVNTFFNQMLGGYILGPYVQEYYQGQQDEFHKHVADIDDRLMMVMNLRRGTLLKVFPVTAGGKTTWYAPTDNLDGVAVDSLHRKYMQGVFSLVYQEVLAGNIAHVDAIFDKMLKYQQVNGGSSLPTGAQVEAERVYNAVPFATILFMVNLTAGVLLVAFAIYFMVRGNGNNGRNGSIGKTAKVANVAGVAVSVVSLAALTACLALRWVAGGRVPMANGYETMLVMAWSVMLLSLVVCRRFRIIVPFGLLMSGFFLLVSHINYMNPQITHVMPVLQSPLLSVHVSVIMMSFALLSLTFVCGVTALLLRLIRGRNAPGIDVQTDSLALLSRLLLYPAVALLAVGVFVGAVWANVSWGTYWSWDAKEVWGLVTLLVYAVAVHEASLPFLRRPVGFHLFMVLAFLTIIMTYFGVNYFLGGMHSYA